jgi:hypothetical protein
MKKTLSFIKEFVLFTPFGLSQVMIASVAEGLQTIPAILWSPVV